MLVGFPVGGGADVAARTLGPRMSELLGQQIIVDNRPGAGSSLASEMAAKSTPDGYTLVSIGSTHAVNAAMNPKLPYAPAAGFHAIALVSTAPVTITANLSLPAKSLKELIALAKARPGQINYGPGGVNGINHLAAELLKRMGGFDITLIPYKGVAQALPAVIAGEVQLMFGSLPGSIDQIRAGRIRAIAVTSAKRSNAAPEIPTVAESGVPGYEAPSWWGFLAPAGIPDDARKALTSAIEQAVKSPAIAAKLAPLGILQGYGSPEQMAAEMREEFHASQIKKPMPTPPINISAATMASSTVRIAMRARCASAVMRNAAAFERITMVHVANSVARTPVNTIRATRTSSSVKAAARDVQSARQG